MFDINKHRFYLVRILKDIFTDIELAGCLGFKGGTAQMFFYDLPRFSVDLDFNLVVAGKEELVLKKIKKILLKYGALFDEAQKFYGPILVLDYGIGDRKLKVEISNRIFNDKYEIRNLLGINIVVMVSADMFAHKLCALLDRSTIANRDIFDCWFFMQKQTSVNPRIIEARMNMSLSDYLQKCIEILESKPSKGLLVGMGELMDEGMKNFARTKLLSETIGLMKFYKEFPILA
jgi:predicted nucleotidyltransferase component of viral defense system